jgi:hypothetical protein
MVYIEKKQQESCGTASKEYSKRECNTPRTTRKTTTEKSVSFKHTVQARKTLHVMNYTEEEVKACWYTREEVKERRRQMHFMVKAIELGAEISEEEDEYCMRGLVEYKTDVSIEKKQHDICGTANKDHSKREYDTPSTIRKTPTGKSVSFKPTAVAQDIRHILDYTEEEVNACWYTGEEVKERRRQIKLTIKAIEQNIDIFEEEDEYCIRGQNMCSCEIKSPKPKKGPYRSVQ